MDRTLVRRIGGTAVLLLIFGLALMALRTVNGPASGTIRVHAVLGRAGAGVNQNTDVKVRGVKVGKVVGIDYTEGRATAILEVKIDPPLPAAEFLELVVTPKTFLGEKQVELFFDDERFGVAPFLEADSTLVATTEPVEVQELIATIEPFLAAIDEQDLADLVEAFAEQQGEGENIAKNIEVGTQLAEFGSRTADAQLRNFERLSSIADALAPRTDDFNRFNTNLPKWATLIQERQADITTNLDSLTTFSIGLAEFLEVNESDIRLLFTVGETVGAVFDRQIDRIADIVYGLYRYSDSLGHHGGNLNDGTEFAPFRNFLEGDDLQAQICEGLGPLAAGFPQCAESGEAGQ